MKVSHTIVKNKLPDKPNEDNFWVDIENNVFIVVDGVSRDKEKGVYPTPSPSAELTEIFLEYFKQIYSSELSLTSIFRNANKKIHLINKSYQGYFKPGLVALGISIKNNKVEWTSIGDCIGLLAENKVVKRFNTKQTEKLRTTNEKFDSRTIRSTICNNPNHALGYGVLDGNINAEFFIESGEFEIGVNSTICIFTDGLEMFTRPELTNLLLEKPVNELIEIAEQIEISEHIRTDDKTIIKLEF